MEHTPKSIEEERYPFERMATIQVIDELHPIEGKDRIMLAKILGWYCIVSANYKVGIEFYSLKKAV